MSRVLPGTLGGCLISLSGYLLNVCRLFVRDSRVVIISDYAYVSKGRCNVVCMYFLGRNT